MRGSGQYLFLSPNGRHHRRSTYARRIFQPAADGRYPRGTRQVGKSVLVDAAAWPGTPIPAWPDAVPGREFVPPRGRGIQVVGEDVSVAVWLPLIERLTPHGLRHSHKTWMLEDAIPEVLQAERLGHTVPGIRGVYSHVSESMRDDLKAKLQRRWENSLTARLEYGAGSPVPVLNGLLEAARKKAGSRGLLVSA